MKKILYATDFSKNAEKAFHYALKIAEKHRTELIMLPYTRENEYNIDIYYVLACTRYIRPSSYKVLLDITPSYPHWAN